MNPAEPLGLSLVKGMEESAYPATVKSITKGKQAEAAGVESGMHIHAVQNQSCVDKDIKYVLGLIKTAKSGDTPFDITLAKETEDQGAYEHMQFEEP